MGPSYPYRGLTHPGSMVPPLAGLAIKPGAGGAYSASEICRSRELSCDGRHVVSTDGR